MTEEYAKLNVVDIFGQLDNMMSVHREKKGVMATAGRPPVRWPQTQFWLDGQGSNLCLSAINSRQFKYLRYFGWGKNCPCLMRQELASIRPTKTLIRATDGNPHPMIPLSQVTSVGIWRHNGLHGVRETHCIKRACFARHAQRHGAACPYSTGGP
jgi:hypothetical protein